MRISLPLQLIAVLLFVFTLGHYVNEGTVRFFFTVSVIFKEFLKAFLPLVVFFFIADGILALKENAAKILTILVTSIFISNMIVALVAFGVGNIFLPFIIEGVVADNLKITELITPYISFTFPEMMIIPSIWAMIGAVVLGITLSVKDLPAMEAIIKSGKNMVETILNRVFIPVIPFYVIGFLLKLKFEGTFLYLFQSYGKAYGVIITLHAAYLFFLYLVANNLHLSNALRAMRVSSASYLTAFSTMSSTAAIPVTVKCAVENTGNRSLAAVATPIMANVHLLGDCVTTPILALVSMSLFLGHVPGILTFIKFVIAFSITMLAASGVPGGGIIVMLPILRDILGFSDAMLGVITTLYLLQDSFGTAANVMGDGGLMILLNNWLRRFKII